MAQQFRSGVANGPPLQHRPCPVCAAVDARFLFRQAFEQLSGAMLLSGYDILACSRCGAAFAGGIPVQSVFDDYYRELSKYDCNDRDKELPLPKDRRFVETAETFAKHIPRFDSRILEIGSASGELLSELKERGFKQVQGVDPSPGCCRAARDIYGVESAVGTIFDMPAAKDRPDFVILVGVMEHICDVAAAVERIRAMLPEAGRVYVEVPDASRFTASADAPYQEFSVEHVNFFSLQSLTNLMLMHGFRAVTAGRAVRPLNAVEVPVAYGIFEKADRSAPIERDVETEPNLQLYIAEGSAEDARIRARIEREVPAGERIIVWGVGTHTQRLLANGGLNPENIELFVDSNSKYQRLLLHGVPIVAPEALHRRTEAILISSRGQQQQIYNQIRYGLAITNRVITLYA